MVLTGELKNLEAAVKHSEAQATHLGLKNGELEKLNEIETRRRETLERRLEELGEELATKVRARDAQIEKLHEQLLITVEMLEFMCETLVQARELLRQHAIGE